MRFTEFRKLYSNKASSEVTLDLMSIFSTVLKAPLTPFPMIKAENEIILNVKGTVLKNLERKEQIYNEQITIEFSDSSMILKLYGVIQN